MAGRSNVESLNTYCITKHGVISFSENANMNIFFYTEIFRPQKNKNTHFFFFRFFFKNNKSYNIKYIF